MEVSLLGIPLHRRDMSWSDYLALDDDVPGEYYDRHHVIAPSPDKHHQKVCGRLLFLLEASVPPEAYEVVIGWQWSPSPGQNFIPDLMVCATTSENIRLTTTPVLAVEVLSTNRRDDLVVKTTRYAAAGLEHYWVLDRAAGQLHVYGLRGNVYELTQLVDAEPTDVSIGVATVRVDMASLLGLS